VVEVDSTRLVHDATVGMLTHLDGDNEVIDRVPLLDPGAEVAYATGRQAGARDEFRTSTSGVQLEVPTVVLVKGGRRGRGRDRRWCAKGGQHAALVGERRFSVADVTKNIPLSDGSLVRLTVARYSRPRDRRSIAPASRRTSPRRPERSPRPRMPSSSGLRRC
jgi:hypothetical protein